MMLQLIVLVVVITVAAVMWDLYRPAHRDLPLSQFHWSAPLVGRFTSARVRRRALALVCRWTDPARGARWRRRRPGILRYQARQKMKDRTAEDRVMGEWPKRHRNS